jgi:hypothetical protein
MWASLVSQADDRLGRGGHHAGVHLGHESGQRRLGGSLSTPDVLGPVALLAGERVGALEEPTAASSRDCAGASSLSWQRLRESQIAEGQAMVSRCR